MASWIGVVDCNNFFVSCERLFRPDLQRKPVAVLSSNDGCIVARSQEIKDIGVPMGVPYFKVKDIIKDSKAVLFSSHFTLYRDVSRRVFSVLEEHLDIVEQYSIDEAFFLVPEGADSETVANEIKRKVEKLVGIPVSVGVGLSKTQAKYAVELAKKATGVKVLNEDEWIKLSKHVKLSELWGVGGRSFLRYQKAGYHTVTDLIQADKARIKAMFGVGGERLASELNGIPAYPVSNLKKQPQKSMMSTRSFSETTEDMAVLEDAVAYHTRHIAKDLRMGGQKAGAIRVMIRPSKYSDFVLQGTSLESILDAPTNDTFSLLKISQSLLQKAYKLGVPYKKVGVIVGRLVAEDVVQEQLFPDVTAESNVMNELMDNINSKADRELLILGDRKKSNRWQARRDLVSPAYTTKWTDVAKVKA